MNRWFSEDFPPSLTGGKYRNLMEQLEREFVQSGEPVEDAAGN